LVAPLLQIRSLRVLDISGARHMGLTGVFKLVLPNIELGHSGTTVTKDDIIMSRSVIEEGVCSNAFIPAMNLVCRGAGIVVFVHK
jgi:hypothetical protein